MKESEAPRFRADHCAEAHFYAHPTGREARVVVPTARRGRPRTRERDPQTVRVELRLPQNVAGALYERADLDDRTVTATVTRLLEDALLGGEVEPSADLQ